jgi:Putative auto-transporter adhesin, head GIN domain
LEVQKESGESVLSVALKGNRNNRMYIEGTRMNVKITMPEASVVRHRGNDDLRVKGILGRYFRLEQEGNGDATLQGTIEELDIKKSGNGDVKAKELIAQTAKVKNYGNGNVLVNSKLSLTANGAGNGDVLQFGNGKINSTSNIMGNGVVKTIPN